MKYLLNTFLILIFSFSFTKNNTEESLYINEIKKFQKEMNEEFKNPKTSPLTDEDIKIFKKLDFYPIDSNFRVVAMLKLNKKKKEFGMKTTTSRLPIYINYGIASFKLNGKKFKINIYQNVELSKKEKYKDYLFMLFTDKTSGKTSYAGGRYIDLRIPKDGKLLIDFNKAYNPYCAYNHKYSCPIPPEEDYFDMEIKAGVMKYH
jgi:uncharacterized protein (DUF1684 family)